MRAIAAVVANVLILAAMLWAIRSGHQRSLQRLAQRPPAPRPIVAAEMLRLVSELPAPRGIGSQGHDAARQHLVDHLQAQGLEVEQRSFQWDGWPGAQLANLEVRLPARAAGAPVLVVGAHYDTLGTSPGADDNGSGVAALLALARRLRDRPLEAEVWLVFFDAEEHGLIGSRAWLRDLPAADRSRLRGMINLESIGYADHRAGSQRMPSTVPRVLFDPGDRGDFILLLGNIPLSWGLFRATRLAFEEEQRATPGFRIEAFGAVPGAGLNWIDVRRSDHASFWDADVPAVLLTDSANFRNPHYHRWNDTPETLDAEFLAAVTRGVERVVLRLAGR